MPATTGVLVAALYLVVLDLFSLRRALGVAGDLPVTSPRRRLRAGLAAVLVLDKGPGVRLIREWLAMGAARSGER